MYGSEYNLSPRAHFIKTESSWFRFKYYSIYFLDLDREKEISIAPDWPTDLAEDECILTKSAADIYNVEVGDRLRIKTNF